jgi:hypothetical protein
LFEEQPRPSRDPLVGVLRTILGSVDTWKSVSPTSRGHLSFLEGFVGKLGVSVQECGPDLRPLPESEVGDDDDRSEELLSLGERWCRFGDQDARGDFLELADLR